MNSCKRELLKDLLQQVHAVVSSIHNSYTVSVFFLILNISQSDANKIILG